jgi:hypothetical protein
VVVGGQERHAGVGAGSAAAVVLIYRATSWLLLSVIGWINYG